MIEQQCEVCEQLRSLSPGCCFCGGEQVAHIAIKSNPLAAGKPFYLYCCACAAKDELGEMIDQLLARDAAAIEKERQGL